ncbi:MAG: protein kinase [Planctomycetaceae bacterium]
MSNDPRFPNFDDEQDPAQPSGGPSDDEASNGDTVSSDQFDEPAAADSQTFISDEFEEPVAADSQTFISDEFDEPAATIDSDSGDDDVAVAADSRTFISDEFDEPIAADSQTFVSDEFEEPAAAIDSDNGDDVEVIAADSQTFVSDEFDDVESPAESKTFVSEDFGGGIGGDTFGEDEEGPNQTYAIDADDSPRNSEIERTIAADIDGTSEDSRTIMSDEFDDPGILDGSDVRQTINPKSLDSKDREHWNKVIQSALGSDAPKPGSKKGSSLVGGGSNLNIQTRTIVEGPVAQGRAVDYRIEKKLGEGGMGAVYLANQQSLNRNVALKIIKPIGEKEKDRLRRSGRLNTIREHREGQFLSEAVITGDLEHPNIVPIYDVAASSDGTVFYAMKCVVGTPWLKVIRKKSLHENLDILLKVCDAMAFAHSRGVVHRDLKPENVMLGEFGVVLVMDWGLAIVTKGFSKLDSVRKATSLGGSPAYMAELATGPLDRIGPAADIYLIGAMLYEAMTGRPPHSGSNVSQCLRSAASNKIDPSTKQGELMDIALKAMAAKPEDRYATVQEFQQAVRGYLEHAESIGLAERASEDLEKARQTQQYGDYARAMFGFEQAVELWEGNTKAQTGLREAQLAYAEHALDKQDFELGLSLLDQQDENHAPIVSRLQHAQREQESRKARLSWMKRVAAAMLAVILIGGTAAFGVIYKQRNDIALERDAATEAKKLAEVARDDAVRAEQVAVDERERAETERQKADDERKIAEQQRQIAVEQRQKADAATAVAIAAKQEAEESAEAEKVAKLAAIESQKKAEEARALAVAAEKKAVESAMAEATAKNAAIAALKKAEAATIAEAKAKELAVAEKLKAEESEKKAVAAATAEMKAKELAVAEKLKAEESRRRRLPRRLRKRRPKMRHWPRRRRRRRPPSRRRRRRRRLSWPRRRPKHSRSRKPRRRRRPWLPRQRLKPPRLRKRKRRKRPRPPRSLKRPLVSRLTSSGSSLKSSARLPSTKPMSPASDWRKPASNRTSSSSLASNCSLSRTTRRLLTCVAGNGRA